MNETPFHFALRETQNRLQNRAVWIGMISAGIILGVVSPFGSGDTIGRVPLLLFWVFVCVTTHTLGTFVATAINVILAPTRLPDWLKITLAGIGVGIDVAIYILLVNWVVFGIYPLEMPYFQVLSLNILFLSIVITFANVLIGREISKTEPEPNLAPQPALLDRLALSNRGELVSLTVQDHYVEVTTTKGSELVLMRLADAIKETAPTQGLRVHRSHWVATHAVSNAKRDGARAVLTLSDGRDIPVSRTYVPAVKEAAFLP